MSDLSHKKQVLRFRFWAQTDKSFTTEPVLLKKAEECLTKFWKTTWASGWTSSTKEPFHFIGAVLNRKKAVLTQNSFVRQPSF